MTYSAGVLLALVITAPLLVPTHARAQQSAADSVRRTERLAGVAVTRPQKAGLLSAVLPGAGQLYNRRYWKVPVATGLVGGAVYMQVLYARRYQEYRQGYLLRQRAATGDATAVDTGPRSGQEPSDAVQKARFYSYRTTRDIWMGITAATYGVQILDAVVDAHLHDFDISDTLTLHWRPALLSTATASAAPGFTVTVTTHAARGFHQ
jgi:hypothetical protein